MTQKGCSRNNWLSVSIDESERQKIYEIIQILDEQINGQNPNHFYPMNLNDVHITAIFFGQNFHKIKNEISDVQTLVPRRIFDEIYCCQVLIDTRI